MSRKPSPRLVPRLAVPAMVAALVAAVPALAADLTIVAKVSSQGSPATTTTSYYTETRILSADGNVSSIVDLESGRLTFVDHQKKSYWETSREEIAAQLAQVEAMLRDNPALASMLGPATDVQVETPGDSRTIAGHQAIHHVLRIGGMITMELWAAPDVKLPGGYADARKAGYAMMGPMGSRFEKLIDAMSGLGGMPLATQTRFSMMGQQMTSESEVVEIREGAVDPAVFAPPKGYKKVASPLE